MLIDNCMTYVVIFRTCSLSSSPPAPVCSLSVEATTNSPPAVVAAALAKKRMVSLDSTS